MRNYFYAASIRKTMMIAATLLVLVFLAGAADALPILHGTVTINGQPCKETARVTLTDIYQTNAWSVTTDTNGAYSIDLLDNAGYFTLSVNLVDGVAPVDEEIYLDVADNLPRNIDITQAAVVPMVDDFTGTFNANGKWQLKDWYFKDYTPVASTDLTPTSATVTAGGSLMVTPHAYNGGVITAQPINAPGNCVFECKFPQTIYPENLSYNSPSVGFSLFDAAQDKTIVDVRAIPYYTNNPYPRIFIYKDGNGQTSYNDTTALYRSGSTECKTLWSSGPRIVILKTVTVNKVYYDLYYAGELVYTVPMDTNVTNPYIYMYATEARLTNNTYATKAYFDDVRAGTPQYVGSVTPINEVKTNITPGNPVAITDAIVSVSFNNAFWVVNEENSCGIKIVSSAKPLPGTKVSVVGTYTKVDREPAILASSVGVLGSTTAPNYFGITGKVAGELDKAGATALGMYVKSAGRVTWVTTNENNKVNGYYLDDGSGIVGDGEHQGLYVQMNPDWNFPKSALENQFVTAKGSLTVYSVNGTVIPSIRAILPVGDDPEFMAFNDCAIDPTQYPTDSTIPIGHHWESDNDPNDPTKGHEVTDYGTWTFDNRFTTYTVGNTGALMDRDSTKYVNAIVSIVGTWSGPDNTIGAYFNDVPTSDAYIFSGAPNSSQNLFMNMRGIIKGYGSAYKVELNFSGLSTDPNYRYQILCTTNKGYAESQADYTKYIISGATSYTNSSAAYVAGNPTDTVTLNIGGNNAGVCANWTNIIPSADGTFKVTARGLDDGDTEGFLLSCFMLKRYRVSQ